MMMMMMWCVRACVCACVHRHEHHICSFESIDTALPSLLPNHIFSEPSCAVSMCGYRGFGAHEHGLRLDDPRTFGGSALLCTAITQRRCVCPRIQQCTERALVCLWRGTCSSYAATRTAQTQPYTIVPLPLGAVTGTRQCSIHRHNR